MRTALRCLAIATLGAVLACAQQEPAPPIDTSMDAEIDNAAAIAAINAVREAEVAAIRAGTADASYLAADAVLMPPGEPAVSGLEAIRSWMEAFVTQYSADATYTDSEITVAGDMAVETYTATLTLTPVGGGDAVSETIKGIHVYRRGADGMWKMVHDVWNSDAPPPGM